MEFFKKRSTAAVILVLVIIVFTVLGINLSAARVVRAAERQFYDGVYIKSEKYTETAIETHLEKKEEAALGLLSLNYGTKEQQNALRDARDKLLSARTISEKYAANQALEEAWHPVAEWMTLLSVLPPESAKTYVSTLEGAQSAIEKSSYNDAARKANDSILGGVLRPLRLLNFARDAELFA